jgi:arylsulfatase A-like enzyme
MRAHGLIWATPLAAIAIVLSELTRVPADAHRADLGRLLAALAELARSALFQFAGPASVLLAVLVICRWAGGERTPRQRRIARVLLASLGVAESALLREVLLDYTPFAQNVAANTGFVVLAIALAALFVWLAETDAPRRIVAPLGVLLAVVSLVLARAHYVVYVGLYPSLHSCAVSISFVGLALGLGLTAAPLPRPSFARPIALAVLVPLLVLALLDPPAAAWARPYVAAYTELGRAAGVARALELEAEHLAPTDLPAARTDPLLAPDVHAARRFAERSGFPALPSSFDLSDYDVLLVLGDATRYDRTSLARREGPTPHLASLERRGAYVFERAYSPSNGTFPSVASMLAMTPVSFAELDIRPRFWRGRLRSERTTAPEAMRAAGRATFWVGHDHAGCFSQNIGGLAQGFDERVLVPDEERADARIARRAIEAIRSVNGRRYFGLVFFGSPHDPYRERYDDRPSETDLDRYDHELAYQDEQLGRLLTFLETSGRLARTVVIFAGDHGEAFGEHDQRYHLSSLYDEQIHVPLVVRIGGVGGARIPSVVSSAHVLPWLLARGSASERDAAGRVLREDIGPLMRALDGAVVSEMIGPSSQHAAFLWDEHTVVYDVLADLIRVYDAHADPRQENDLRETRPDLLGHFAPVARRYRRVRSAGRRFRFIGGTYP